MSEQKKPQSTKMIPFTQEPYYDPEQTFTITAEEMEAMLHVSEAYSKFIPVMDNMLQRFINEQLIKVKYIAKETGKELSKDEVIAMIKQMADEQRQQQSVEPDMS